MERLYASVLSYFSIETLGDKLPREAHQRNKQCSVAQQHQHLLGCLAHNEATSSEKEDEESRKEQNMNAQWGTFTQQLGLPSIRRSMWLKPPYNGTGIRSSIPPLPMREW
jgi:hypothetical protein